MDIEEAQYEFKRLLTLLAPRSVNVFLKWTKDFAVDVFAENESGNHVQDVGGDIPVSQIVEDRCNPLIEAIHSELCQKLPLTGNLASENISYPESGELAGCESFNTLHVDGFLYDEGEVQEMQEEGKFPKMYCKNCRSTDVAEFNMVSHSMSRLQLIYIFRFLLPSLHGKLLLDVGSRIGAVLYGAFCYSNVSEIIGVEINQDYCQIQTSVVEKFKMGSRIRVICDDVSNCETLLKKADVIVLNNVFEFFMQPDNQKRLWIFLHKTLRKTGTYLVTSPKLEHSLQLLQMDINLDDWVRPISTTEKSQSAAAILFEDTQEGDLTELDNIFLYQIL